MIPKIHFIRSKPALLQRLKEGLTESLQDGGLPAADYVAVTGHALASLGFTDVFDEFDRPTQLTYNVAVSMMFEIGAQEVRGIDSRFVCLEQGCPSDDVQAALVQYYSYYNRALRHVKRIYTSEDTARCETTVRELDECVTGFLTGCTDLPQVAGKHRLSDVIGRIVEEIRHERWLTIYASDDTGRWDDFDKMYSDALRILRTMSQ